VTATAEAPISPTRGTRTRIAAASIAACFLAFLPAAAAKADIGATVSIFSDDRYRGYSLSQERPVAILDFAYDDPSGFYAGASGTGVIRRGGDPAPLGFELNAGFAKRLESGTTIDVGLTGSSYSYYSKAGSRKSYAEIYAGVSRGIVSSRIFLSPHYSENGLWTAYGEVNANYSPGRNWGLEGHVGMLVPLQTPNDHENYRTAFDWRLGVTRQLGPVSIHASWVQGARGSNYYGGGRHDGHALVVGASLPL
jgi:uncharacterized protein (TIGR02001 family)